MKGNRAQPFDLSRTQPPPVVLAETREDFELEPAANHAPLTSAQPAAELAPLNPHFEAAGPPVAPPPRAWPVYLAAALVSALWALGPTLYAVANPRAISALQTNSLAIAAAALLGLGPIVLIWIAAYLVQQGRALAAETRRARALAESLLAPAALAARGAGSAVDAVRQEIQRASEAAAQAQNQLTSLREALAAESERLVEAASGSSRAAGALTESLAGEREKMEGLTSALDTRAASITEAIASQARMVGEASDLAETQVREAEAALAARAADLAAAAGEASDAAKTASDTLTRQVDRLETAGLSVVDQARAIEESLAEQRAALVSTAHGLRADHETYAVEAESLRAQLSETIAGARGGAAELGETAARSADVLRQMIAAAGEHLRELAQTASAERDQLTARAAHSMSMIAELAGRERETLEERAQDSIGMLAASATQARQTAEGHVAAARGQVDQLGEVAFAAGQKAVVAFDARLDEARQIIERSASLVDEASAKTSERLNQGVAAARDTLAALEATLIEIDQRLARAPIDAQAQTQAIRQNVERGIEALMASARSAAEETQNIDAAFQERVRRNYDMLSEAVRLMGVVAGAAGTTGQRTPRPAPPPQAAPPPAAAPAPAAEAAPPRPVAREPEAPAPAPPPAPSPALDSAGLRPRLKLTPTATDEEFKSVFEAAGGQEQAETIGDSWTWKELLSSMDDAPIDDGALAGVMLGEVEAMGIDAAALVPRARIDEIAAAFKTGGMASGRDQLRRLAPAAIRRLSRRMMADRNFHAQAERYVRRYQGLIAEAASREGEAFSAQSLLGSDQGRAFLLLDAAIAEAG
jgi:predicted  nucleic acid-binding Zn-ribbon protein